MKIYASKRYDRLDPRKYIGQDIWIHSLVQGDEGYVRINSQVSDILKVDFILDYTLRNKYPEIRNLDLYIISKVVYLDEIDIEEPLIILTSDEIVEKNNLPKWTDFVSKEEREYLENEGWGEVM